MPTVTHDFDALVAYNTGSNIAELYAPDLGQLGSPGWIFNANTLGTQAITFRFNAVDYSSGPMTVTVHFYGITPSATGSLNLTATIASQQPNVSTETARNPVPATTGTGSRAVSATQYAPQSVTLSVTNTDGAAEGYPCYLTIARGDTAASEVVIYAVTVSYSDGQSVGTGDVTGPASSTSGNLVTFNGTTGKIIQDSGITIASLGDVDGPASAASGNIASYSGTTGKIIQDSGVSATAHAARHNVNGADALFPGTWTANDTPVWNGTIWVPKLYEVVAIASTVISGGATGLADIPGLTIAIPRAGTYRIGANLQYVLSGTAAATYIAWNFTGTLTAANSISSRGLAQSSATAAAAPSRYVYLNQIANNAQVAAAWTGTITAERILVDYNGFISCTTAGTLALRLNRTSTATTVTFDAGSMVHAMEA